MSLHQIEEFLASEVEEGLIATGGQLYVSVDGDAVVDLAVGVDGIGHPVSTECLFAVYCAGKPAFVVALAHLVANKELSWDDRLGDLINQSIPASLAGLTVRELLNHTSGLHAFHAHLYFALSEGTRWDAVVECQPPPGWHRGGVAYCQVVPWHLLSVAMEDLTGVPVATFVRERVLAPLGVEHDVFVAGMGTDQHRELRDRLRVNVYLDGLERSPILVERNSRFRCLTSPAFGNTASARGLGRFYEGLLGVRGDAEVVALDLLDDMTRLSSYGFDPVMARECGYGLGLMVRMSDHAFGRFCSARSFGHSGYGGMTAAFADPDVGLVVALHLNGRIDAETAVIYHRRALIEQTYRSLGLATRAADVV